MRKDTYERASVDQLNQMQRYLGEETVEEYQAGLMSRRQMLRRLLIICGSTATATALLAACGEGAQVAQSEPTQPPVDPVLTAVATTGPEPSTAPAVQPLSVAADDPAVTGSEVTFQGDASLGGYLARPQAEGTYPGVIVIHENRGLTDHIRDVARRLSKAGYVALAPDLAARAGGTAQIDGEQIRGYFGNAKPEELVSDLNAAVEFLGQQPGVAPDTFGVTGFCFGGAYTLRLAAANPKIAAAVCYYGVTPEPASQMSATNAAILGQYGSTDARVNATIPALEQVMLENGKTFEKRIYEGANHAFNNDTGANYNEEAAVTAWQATLGWFEQYLKG